MAKTRPTTILLKSNNTTYEEGTAKAALSPGHLVELYTDREVQKHSVSGGPAELCIALEDALQGRTYEDAYAAGELVQIAILKPGEVALVKLAIGNDVSEAEYLASNGDGTFKVASGTDFRLMKPLEALSNDDASDDEVIWIRARAL